jgi:sialic acid synthase SpsE
MLRSEGKAIQPCEKGVMPVVRRGIAAGANLSKGQRLRLRDLIWLRSSGTLIPGQESRLIGKILKRNLRFGEAIEMADVKGVG